ncbi:hypothetical protein ACFOPN_01705 [Xanthomonas hyacinthi]|uniref:hypothetical protein n=1 Tax=Xanthomonas hyacinthi TaxID=56455 RepID=UPI00360B8BDE
MSLDESVGAVWTGAARASQLPEVTFCVALRQVRRHSPWRGAQHAAIARPSPVTAVTCGG